MKKQIMLAQKENTPTEINFNLSESRAAGMFHGLVLYL
jgi:hypothetical protein